MNCTGFCFTRGLLPGLSLEVDEAKTSTIWGNFAVLPKPLPKPQRYFYIPSHAELRKYPKQKHHKHSPGRPKSLRSVSNPNLQNQIKPKSIQRPKSTMIVPEEPQFEPYEMCGADGVKWLLGCVCRQKTEEGLLVECEKCSVWQHAICLRINKHTMHDYHLCHNCSNTVINCKCGKNNEYRLALIRCSQCMKYSHQRCEGLNYGPVPLDNFICHSCGKYNYELPYVKLPDEYTITSATYTFTESKIEHFDSQYLGGPFTPFFTDELFDKSYSAREFCEKLYNRYRSFFFLCHPLYYNALSKKKRNRLLTSFLQAIEYMCNAFYHIKHDKFIDIFDSLIYQDIYYPNEQDKEDENELDFTDAVRPNLSMIPNVIRMQGLPKGPQLRQNSSGLTCSYDLASDQFIGTVVGLVGDLEEFDYSPRVNSAYYQIVGTRCVLDTTLVSTSQLHKMKRSMNGNCVLKLIQIGDQFLCGIFVGRNRLTLPGTNDTFDGIKAGCALTFGFDFMPAVMKDLNQWITWHCSDSENISIIPRPSSREQRIIEREKPVKHKKRVKIEADSPKKIKRGRKPIKRAGPPPIFTEVTLFGLFESISPGNILIKLQEDTNEPEEEQNSPIPHEDITEIQSEESIGFISEESTDTIKERIHFPSLANDDPEESMKRLLGLAPCP